MNSTQEQNVQLKCIASCMSTMTANLKRRERYVEIPMFLAIEQLPLDHSGLT